MPSLSSPPIRGNVAAVRLPLSLAFAVAPGQVVSLAGGGGKTTLMYLLAQELVREGRRVVTTTTTRIYPPAGTESPSLMLLEDVADPVPVLRASLAETRHVTVAARRTPDGKLAGIPGPLVDALSAAGVADVVIVEADGSAGRPLKAARDGEPIWPESTSTAILVAGVDGVDQPLDETVVFRSAIASEILGLPLGAPMSAAPVATLLIGPRGLARTMPARSRLVVFLNKVEDARGRGAADHLARALLDRADPRLARIVAGSLQRAAEGFVVLDRSH